MREPLSTPSKHRKNNLGNPDGLVRVQDCQERHEVLKQEFSLIKTALFGSDGRGGMVKDIGDIKSDFQLVKERMKNRWGAKDKAAIIAALIMAATGIIVALLK